MAIITGQAVRGDNFWNRKVEIEDLWEELENGSHILMVAPRRVGKTSIMYKLLDESKDKDNYLVVYIDTESANSENEFWQKVFHKLLDDEFIGTVKNKTKSFFNKVKTISIDEISTKGVKFGDGKTLDYVESFKNLMKGLDSDKKIIIMIDEFAQTIENLLKEKNIEGAENLLKIHREIRQDKQLSEKIRFIYAGSIGLETVVSKIKATKYINDLTSVKVLPLVYEDAKKFTIKLNIDNKLNIDDAVIDYILEKIEWLIPFYIQLILKEVKTLSRRTDKIDKKVVDDAIENSLGHRNYFEHWRSKLEEGLERKEYLFAKEVLNYISGNQTMKSKEIFNLATKHKLDEDEAKEIIHSLVYDGYINNNDNPKIYRFNSPILRMWWYKNVAN
jgi:hypothetical protein